MVLMIGVLTGCGKGNNSETQATSEESLEAWTFEPTTPEITTAAPTTEASTTAEPTTEFPKMGTPNYRFAMIDHAKVGENYYSTYYLEFDQPGYYISDSTGKSKYYAKDGDTKYSNPSRVFQWVEHDADGQIYYKVSLVFISKGSDKVPEQDLTFEVPVRYRYDSENSAYIETMAMSVNTPIGEITIDNMADNAPLLLDGHYLSIAPEKTGLSYGIPNGDKSREYGVIVFSYVRLSYENIDFNSLKNHLAIVKYDRKKKTFSTYKPPEGYETIIVYSEGVENGFRYLQIGIGLSYPKGQATKDKFDIKKEMTSNTALVYMDDGKIVYYAYYD